MPTLLIVDDSRILQKVLEKILSPHFQIVGRGSSGNEGFDLYQKLKPDLVLMDITMPDCSGKESLEKIIGFDKNATVIMVSSIADAATVKDCLELGAKGFVCKEKVSHSDNESSVLIQTVQSVMAQSTKDQTSSSMKNVGAA